MTLNEARKAQELILSDEKFTLLHDLIRDIKNAHQKLNDALINAENALYKLDIFLGTSIKDNIKRLVREQ